MDGQATSGRSPLLISIVVLSVILVAVVMISRVWTEYLWFDNVNFATVFTTQLAAQAGLFAVFGLFMALASTSPFLWPTASGPAPGWPTWTRNSWSSSATSWMHDPAP